MKVYDYIISTHFLSAGKMSSLSCYVLCIHKIPRGISYLDVSSSDLTTLNLWLQSAMLYLYRRFLQHWFLPNSSTWFTRTISHKQISVMYLWALSFIYLDKTGRLVHPNGFHACQFDHLCVEVPALLAWSDLAMRCVYTGIHLYVVYTIWYGLVGSWKLILLLISCILIIGSSKDVIYFRCILVFSI